jgi:murein L,D-transpeptidase YcbB/YkuD
VTTGEHPADVPANCREVAVDFGEGDGQARSALLPPRVIAHAAVAILALAGCSSSDKANAKVKRAESSLPVTGSVDKATNAALQSDLQAKGGAATQVALASTAAVPQTLKLAGFWIGPVDGQWTPALTDALKKFQTQLGVKPTGTVDAATVAALEHAIAKQGASASATNTRPSTPPPTPASPTTNAS